MAPTKYQICDFGWKARDFALEGIDGKTYSLADVRGPKGLLVDIAILTQASPVSPTCNDLGSRLPVPLSWESCA